jgi:hypothetical protein
MLLYISSLYPPKIDVALKITIEFMIDHYWILIILTLGYIGGKIMLIILGNSYISYCHLIYDIY